LPSTLQCGSILHMSSDLIRVPFEYKIHTLSKSIMVLFQCTLLWWTVVYNSSRLTVNYSPSYICLVLFQGMTDTKKLLQMSPPPNETVGVSVPPGRQKRKDT
jgi:hypothetical protein